MRKLLFATLVLLLTTGAASARDGMGLSLGGAATLPSFVPSDEATHYSLMGNGGFSAGLASAPSDSRHGGLQTGGYLAWTDGSFRFDGGIRPSLNGGVNADLGIGMGALPNEIGTSLRLGAGWNSDRFSVNPSSHLGLSEVEAQSPDVNFTLRVNHAVTPNLSVVGTAEARLSQGTPAESTAAQKQYLLGAGLGIRF